MKLYSKIMKITLFILILMVSASCSPASNKNSKSQAQTESQEEPKSFLNEKSNELAADKADKAEADKKTKDTINGKDEPANDKDEPANDKDESAKQQEQPLETETANLQATETQTQKTPEVQLQKAAEQQPPPAAEQQPSQAVEQQPPRAAKQQSLQAVEQQSPQAAKQQPPQATERKTAIESTSQAAKKNTSAAEPDKGPIVLTISGNGVKQETTWSLAKLQSLTEGDRKLTYSTTNNWPNFSKMDAQGISLPYLLRQAGVLNDAAAFTFVSADGYKCTLTYNQVFGKHYSYANHSATGSSGGTVVEPVVAWIWGDAGKAREENIRPFFGQSGPKEVNTSGFVKDLSKIEISTTPIATWAAPTASIPTGSVSAGTELELLHESRDSVQIYYTLDGSEPTYDSLVFNPSTSYFQPHLIKPLVITQNVTVKAFAAGFGRDASPVVSLSYTVQ